MSWDYKTIKPGSRTDTDKLVKDGYVRYRSDVRGDHYRRKKQAPKPAKAAATKNDE